MGFVTMCPLGTPGSIIEYDEMDLHTTVWWEREKTFCIPLKSKEGRK